MNYFLPLIRSSMRSISIRVEEFTNSDTDLKPSSECISIKFLMLKYRSSGIFTSLYDFAINKTCEDKIKTIFDTYGERFNKVERIRHIWRREVVT